MVNCHYPHPFYTQHASNSVRSVTTNKNRRKENYHCPLPLLPLYYSSASSFLSTPPAHSPFLQCCSLLPKETSACAGAIYTWGKQTFVFCFVRVLVILVHTMRLLTHLPTGHYLRILLARSQPDREERVMNNCNTTVLYTKKGYLLASF